MTTLHMSHSLHDSWLFVQVGVLPFGVYVRAPDVHTHIAASQEDMITLTEL